MLRYYVMTVLSQIMSIKDKGHVEVLDN